MGEDFFWAQHTNNGHVSHLRDGRFQQGLHRLVKFDRKVQRVGHHRDDDAQVGEGVIWNL